MYHIINRYLKKYLSEESDVLDYYYMFADVSRKLAHETGSDSITEVLYRRLNEVVVRGKLEKAVQKVDTLRELLLESVSLNGEKQPKKGNKLKEGRSTVGCFEFDSEGNIYGMNETGDEVVIGNNLMKRDMNLQGVIAYNMEYGIYEIRYPRMMNETEKRTVIKCFLQEGDSYRFYADCKVLPEAAP